MTYSRKALTPNHLSCLTLALSLLCAPISTFASRQTDGAILNKGKQSSEVYISSYTCDLTEAAKRGKLEPVNGYTSEINQMVQILAGVERRNAMLVSEPGTIRNVVVEALALRVASGEVPGELQGKHLLRLNLKDIFNAESLVVETRLDGLLAEVKRARGKFILFVDDLDTLSGIDAGPNATAESLLAAALERNEIQLVGGTTGGNLKVLEARNPGIARH